MGDTGAAGCYVGSGRKLKLGGVGKRRKLGREKRVGVKCGGKKQGMERRERGCKDINNGILQSILDVRHKVVQ